VIRDDGRIGGGEKSCGRFIFVLLYERVIGLGYFGEAGEGVGVSMAVAVYEKGEGEALPMAAAGASVTALAVLAAVVAVVAVVSIFTIRGSRVVVAVVVVAEVVGGGLLPWKDYLAIVAHRTRDKVQHRHETDVSYV
jgi:hypothetical protein